MAAIVQFVRPSWNPRALLWRLLAAAVLAGCVYLMLPERAPTAPSLEPEAYFSGKALLLARAVDRNDWDTIDRLINQDGVDPDAIFDRMGRPLLAWPLLTHNPEGLHQLLNAGASPNVRPRHAGSGLKQPAESVLFSAAAMADPRYLIELLMRGGDPNGRNAAGEPLLYVAFIHGHWDNVQSLIMSGAHLDTTLYDDNGYDTVLNWYAKTGRFDRLHWLLEHGGDPTRRMHDLAGSRLAGTAESNEGRMPIVEETFYGQASEPMRAWQQACQAWLLMHNIGRPPPPPALRMRRQQAQGEQDSSIRF